MTKTVLLVEDRPGDARLTQEAFRDAVIPIDLHVTADGAEAMSFLQREGRHANAPRPDHILSDLNLPKINGREVLARLKDDANLNTIPAVILTTAGAEDDMMASYQLRANYYLCNPYSLKSSKSS
jgi:two-component system, chemotaxis family, response regulator Rcp1